MVVGGGPDACLEVRDTMVAVKLRGSLGLELGCGSRPKIFYGLDELGLQLGTNILVFFRCFK